MDVLSQGEIKYSATGMGGSILAGGASTKGTKVVPKKTTSTAPSATAPATLAPATPATAPAPATTATKVAMTELPSWVKWSCIGLGAGLGGVIIYLVMKHKS